MKISLAIPTHDMVPATFMYDVASLCAWTAAAMPDEVEFGINMVPGTYVHAARQQLTDTLIEQGADIVLWLDSDMRFPRDTLKRLLDHRVNVVGINYSKRQIGGGFVAIKEMGGPRLETLPESSGLEAVDAIGMGCVLIRKEALRNLPDPKDVPWFQHKHLGRGLWMGEDVYFCSLLKIKGETIWVDHDLSKECAHVGQFEYRCEHAQQAVEDAMVAA